MELIGFDSNSRDLLPDLVYNLWRNEQSGVWDGVNAWKSVFFEGQEFVSFYFNYLRKYSSEDFLKKFNKDIDHELKQNLSFVCKDNPWYVFHSEYYKSNATLIREKLKDHDAGSAEIVHSYYLEVKSNAAIQGTIILKEL